MAKVILISQFPLPYSKIGSWTTLYTNYLRNEHLIDYVICRRPVEVISNVNYFFIEETLLTKVRARIEKNPYLAYLKVLSKVLNKLDEPFVIQVVDNFGLVPHLINLIEKLGLKKKCYIQFFYHGFAPFLGNFQSRSFFSQINEMILLTYDSYQVHKNYYSILPCAFNVLHNGIDTKLFKPLDFENKSILKKRMNLENKKVFIWCSNDNPKKGLDFLLKVWKQIMLKHDNLLLLVVGNQKKDEIKGVRFIGQISNSELPQYYQVSDCYLFPTLCHEGFGMSMIEALHCGCHVIASSIGGVPEILEYGKYGTLIKSPHFANEWIDAIDDFISKKTVVNNQLSKDLYTSKQWLEGMNLLISNAKSYL